MAIFHLSVKTVSRSAGRSATVAAAYRAGCEIVDERTGEVHDYSHKQGVEDCFITLPDGASESMADRPALWNAAEKSELRKNSTVAREFEVAFPAELDAAQRRELAASFARELVERHGIAVDVAMHAPGKEGDQRNHHAHILTTTRRLTPEGFGEKARELDAKETGPALVEHWRGRWASLANAQLEKAGSPERIDHRSLIAQGIDRAPTVHLGPKATAMERAAARWGGSDRGDQNREADRDNREIQAIDSQVISLKAERDRRAQAPAPAARPAATDEQRATLEAVQLLATAGTYRSQKKPGWGDGGGVWEGFTPAVRGAIEKAASMPEDQRKQELNKLAQANPKAAIGLAGQVRLELEKMAKQQQEKQAKTAGKDTGKER